eukprot:COSAG01_NODE_7329_length_3249_cov_3.335873_3_plen_94_part_00
MRTGLYGSGSARQRVVAAAARSSGGSARQRQRGSLLRGAESGVICFFENPEPIWQVIKKIYDPEDFHGQCASLPLCSQDAFRLDFGRSTDQRP